MTYTQHPHFHSRQYARDENTNERRTYPRRRPPSTAGAISRLQSLSHTHTPCRELRHDTRNQRNRPLAARKIKDTHASHQHKRGPTRAQDTFGHNDAFVSSTCSLPCPCSHSHHSHAATRPPLRTLPFAFVPPDHPPYLRIPDLEPVHLPQQPANASPDSLHPFLLSWRPPPSSPCSSLSSRLCPPLPRPPFDEEASAPLAPSAPLPLAHPSRDRQARYSSQQTARHAAALPPDASCPAGVQADGPHFG